jgi:DNA-binding response OmpR family regulator
LGFFEEFLPGPSSVPGEATLVRTVHSPYSPLIIYKICGKFETAGGMMNRKKTILIVDDEPKILELLKSYVEINGLEVLCAINGRQALELFENHAPDLILLDLMLPDFSGETLCRKIRSVSNVPIIMLTAKVDEESIIAGLDVGADDYITKPFSPKQVAARVKAVLRRSESTVKNEVLASVVCGGLVINIETRSVTQNGNEINLTPNEYKILVLLASRPEKIYTRNEIIEKALGEDFDGFDRAVDTHIKNLRAKIGDDPKNPRCILTVYGMGYRFRND